MRLATSSIRSSHTGLLSFLTVLLILVASFTSLHAQQFRRQVVADEVFATPARNSLAKTTPVESPSVITLALRERATDALRSAGSMLLRDFPIPDGSKADLRLTEFRVFAPDAEFWSRTSAGDVRRPTPMMSFYRGEVANEPGSFVYMAIGKHDISGTIQRSGVEYSFTTMIDVPMPSDNERLLHIYQNTEEMSYYHCGVDDDAMIDEYLRNMPKQLSAGTMALDTLVAKIAVEADHEAYQHFKTVDATETYINTLMGHVTAIYERDVAITLQISYMRTWETPDPYSAASDDAALNTFTDYWGANMGHVDRTLAQLISRKRISADGVSQGLAWVNQLCSKTRGYAFTKLSANNSWISGHTGVWAHEIGHNFGSPHTHSCLWNPPIDSCYTAEPVRGQAPCFSSSDIHLILGGGEMMSYCHMRFGGSAKQNIFRNRTGALVRGRAEAALCMNVTSTVRNLTLMSPTGGEERCGGSTLEITWEAQGNNDFSILLSSDGGATYDKVLVSDIPRSVRSWTWNIPNDQPVGTQYRIKIQDNKLPELVDAMDADFTITLGTQITDQVKWRNVCVGEGAWFYVRATGSGTLRYQWKKNGQNIDGETRDELQLQNLQTSDNLSEFTCVVTGDCGSAESEPALLKVFTSAVITRDLENDTTCIGGSATFSLEAEGSNLSYKWFYRSVTGVNKEFPVNAPELTIQNVQQSDFGSYWCEVNSSCGKSTSKTRFLIVPATAINVLQPGVWDMVIPAGSQYKIGWKHFCVNSVKIEYSIDGGTQWLPITGSFDADAGEYLWNVPKVEAEQCFVRVSNADNTALTGMSKQFKIRNAPVFTLEIPNVGFGWVDVGSTSSKPLVIQNTGLADLQISAATISGSAEVSVTTAMPLTIAPGTSGELMLEYTPTAPEPMSATMRVVHNAAGSPDTIEVFGEGYIATSTPSLIRPTQLSLLQSYPNPIPSGSPATFRFDLPKSGSLTLTAYSLLGSEAKILYSGNRAAGTHNLTLGMHDLPAGAWIIRLTTPEGSVSRMIHILR
ncbi:MAG: M12 family metallo-peptidase [Bacteroidia bacterium]|nr:M12 family metallo-peptidase [Bacteroidia bacterium]